MAHEFISHTTMYHFPMAGVGSKTGAVRMVHQAVGITATGGILPELRSSQDSQAQFDLASSFRKSYGRTYNISHVDHVFDTFGSAAQRSTFGTSPFTFAMTFGVTSLAIANPLMSRRFSTTAGDFSYHLSYNTDGDLIWSGRAASVDSDHAEIPNAIVAGRAYILYVSKLFNAFTNIGILGENEGTWLTATGTEAVNLTFDANYDFIIGGSVDTGAAPGVLDLNMGGAVEAWTFWVNGNSAATLQANLANHFGAADVSATSRSRIVMPPGARGAIS